MHIKLSPKTITALEKIISGDIPVGGERSLAPYLIRSVRTELSQKKSMGKNSKGCGHTHALASPRKPTGPLFGGS
jgi:hypothetical protein